MLIITINKPQFEYDIHSLVKAFYPAEEVKVLTGETSQADWRLFFVGADKRIVWEQVSTGKKWERTAKSDPTTQEEKDELKNQIKLLIYESLSLVTGQELPWGTLTGIRPTKIATTMLEQGKTEEEIKSLYSKNYLVSEEKQELSIEIANRERRLFSGLHGLNGYSLYIGIPFCPTTCLYCSFTSYPIAQWRSRVDEYLDALEKELDYAKNLGKGKILDTVYIGGGTPSTLSVQQMDQLLRKVVNTFPMEQVQEFTVEAGRADSITREKLEVLKHYGITRISINPQTMNQQTLDRIGRKATVDQVLESYQIARELGFDNINMDLILGLPGESEEDVARTMEEIKKLRPESLTIHSLAVKRASKLAMWIKENGLTEIHNTDEMMTIATEGARSMGLVPYYLYRQKNMSGNFENVGYALPDKPGIYNVLIMEEIQSIIACGAGTVTKRVYSNGRIERCDTVKDVGLYIEKIDEMIERKRRLFED